MRRRPMEFWWIAAFCVFKSVLSFRLAHGAAGSAQQILCAHGAILLLPALLLMVHAPLGRIAGFIVLGFEAVDLLNSALLMQNAAWEQSVAELSIFGFCLWMLFYLQSESTRRLCSVLQTRPAEGAAPLRWMVLSIVETGLGAVAGYAAHLAGFSFAAAGCVGLGAYVLYGILLEDWIRRRWVVLFCHCDSDFPTADAQRWRTACNALARGDLNQARREAEAFSEPARKHHAGAFFLRMLAWQELLAIEPGNGEACLRRAALDHAWKPDEMERKRMVDYIECADSDELRKLIDERAELIQGLVKAGSNSSSFFCQQADSALSSISGETFAFNPHESWSAWWEAAQLDWTGDTGSVALVARLLRMDPVAANALSQRIAGRAEEPLLKELSAQVVFLNAMHKAIREHDHVERFLRQPQRILLVPELTDAVGLLHADSQLLESLGMTQNAVTRRLQMRVPLVDYIGALWRRYPGEVGGEMPWLLKTLTGKNLGLLRARSKFEAWWPGERDSFIRHDRAVAAGLAADAGGNDAVAEKSFRDALHEQPRELSSRYNLAKCMIRRNAHDEAAALLRELTQLEPREPYWWMALGLLHRSENKSNDAHVAFKRALELGAPPPRVALHIGLTYARDRHDAEAIKQLDRALGTNPTASKIEALVSTLESEGLWKLAGHYRDEAFKRGLSQPNDDDDGGSNDHPRDEDVAA